MWKLLVFVSLLVATVSAKHEQYQGWKAYWVTPTTRDQQVALGEISGILELDWIQHALVDRAGLTLVKPKFLEQFQIMMTKLGVEYTSHTEDVKRTLDIEDTTIARHRTVTRARNGGKTLPYDVYPTLEEIDAYMIDIASRFNSTVTLHHPGNSFEGRPIYYLTISTTNFSDPNKPVIFIDGGIHAREWISPPSVTYIIHKLTEDVTDAFLLDDIDWIILPVVNPDGYAYTFSNDRFWRKTRSVDNDNWLSSICPGVDGNRNYDFEWNTVGTSLSNCGEAYAGTAPFTEPETRIVRDLVLDNLDRMSLYLTMHSYGSMILYPWGHTGLVAENGLALHRVGKAMAAAIQDSGYTNLPLYSVGNAVAVLGYGASGASEDWAHYVGVNLTYTYELPGLTGGYEGFNPSPTWIDPIVKETWYGIKEGARLSISYFRK